ncbi:MAG: methyltransferase domain-containing protein [Candidatus Paceibacterota bacterium]
MMTNYDPEEIFWKNINESQDAMSKIVWGARTEDDFNKNTNKDAEFITKTLKINKDDIVLDYGAGIGRLAKHISKDCKQVMGLDVSNSMVSLSKKYLEGIDNVSIIHCTGIGESVLALNCITKMYSHIVLQHVNKYKVYYILKNLRHYLAPCGRGMFQFPDLLKDRGEFKNYAKAYITNSDNNCSLHFWTKDEAIWYFKESGWKVIEVIDGETDFWIVAE